MIESIQKEIDNHQVISFDIFDTLILRPYIKPADSFEHIERITGLKKFARARILAERKARRLINDDEISYDDIYNHISKKYKEAYNFETSFEKRICQRNEEIYKLYEYAIEKGKIIIIISDMYLDKDVIEEILKNAGFKNYKYLFLSSDYKKTKSNGDLFDIALKTLEFEPQNILHIGDNPHSDVEVAISKGIHTFHYPKIIDRFLDEHSNLHALIRNNTDERFKRDDLTISLVLGINSILWAEKKATNYWEMLGNLYAAPLLYYFTKWIYDNARKNKIKNIAIVARDGFNVVRIFRLFDHKKEFNPQYVYLPRYVSETSNLHTIDDLHNFFEELGETEHSLKLFIENFSAENYHIDKLWTEYLSKNENYDYQILKNFIIEHQHLFIQTSRNKRDLILNYLQQKDLLNDNIIFVDSSTTQARAQKLIRSILIENNINIQLHGYYYKINQYHKILNQKDIRPYRDKKYRTDKWDIMEYFMSAPESPILSIQKDGDQYLPVYQNIEDNSFEKTRIETCQQMSDGVLMFAERAYSIFNDLPIINDLDTVVLIINNLINNPSTTDISKTKKLQHTINNDSIYNPIITKYRKVKSSIPKIFGQQVHVERISPEYEHFFTGSPDSLVTNINGDEILALNVPFMDREPHPDDKAKIFVINKGGCKSFVNTTSAWNFRKGASLQYIQGNKNKIIYNTLQNKSSGAAIYDLTTQLEITLPLPVVRISENGKKALCLILPRKPIFHTFFAHKLAPKKYSIERSMEQSGVYIMDIETGKVKLITTTSKILGFLNEEKPINKKFFIDELDFTESDENYYMELSIQKPGKKAFRHKLILNLNGEILPAFISNEEILNEKHHLDKKNNDLSAEPENDEYKQKIRGNTFVISQDDFQSNLLIVKRNNNSFSNDGRYCLTETPSSRDFPYIKLFIHDIDNKKNLCLGYFYSNPEYYRNNSICKSHLNPRWSPNDKQIIIDSIHEGYKGIYRINSLEAIAILNSSERIIIHEEELLDIITLELPVIQISKIDIIKKRTKKIFINTVRYLSRNRLFESN